MQKSGIVWDEREFDEFIKEPSAFITGNKMVFLGVTKNQARADIIAYLKEATEWSQADLRPWPDGPEINVTRRATRWYAHVAR